MSVALRPPWPALISPGGPAFASSLQQHLLLAYLHPKLLLTSVLWLFFYSSLQAGGSRVQHLKTRLADRTDLWLPRGWVAGGDGLGVCKLLYIEWINYKVLLYRVGNYIQYPVVNLNGKEYEKEYMYMYNRIILLYSRN